MGEVGPEPYHGHPAVLRGVGASVTAVFGVFALVGLLIMAFGRPVPPGGAAAPQRPTQQPSRPATPSSRPPSPGPAATPTLTAPSPVGASASPATVPGTPTPKGYVAVYNETRHQGLGARVAAEFERAGWRVVRVGNWFGNVPVTTVYYPEGMQEEAFALRDDFPHIGRMRPAFPGVPDNALTVILAKDYPVTSADEVAPPSAASGQ